MKTLVVNCKHEPYEVYIGRPTIWSNPYKIGMHGTREEVIAQYEAYIRATPELVALAKKALRGRILGCVLLRLAEASAHLPFRTRHKFTSSLPRAPFSTPLQSACARFPANYCYSCPHLRNKYRHTSFSFRNPNTPYPSGKPLGGVEYSSPVLIGQMASYSATDAVILVAGAAVDIAQVAFLADTSDSSGRKPVTCACDTSNSQCSQPSSAAVHANPEHYR